MRRALHALAASALFAPAAVVAQAAGVRDGDKAVADSGATPAGWEMRVDPKDANRPAGPKFAAMGAGFHVTSGSAAIYWRAQDAAKGSYAVEGTFTQTKAPAHAEAYGLFFGGRALQSPNQSYMYFLVRQDGKFLINHRADDATVHKVVDWTEHADIRKADAAGKATNNLRVVVGPQRVQFLVNGAEVQSIPRAQVPGGAATLDGLVGLRVNHNLDVHVADFTLTAR